MIMSLEDKNKKLKQIDQLLNVKRKQLASLGTVSEKEKNAFNNLLHHIETVPMPPEEKERLRNKIHTELRKME